MGLCACENQKKRPNQTQQNQKNNTQVLIAPPPQPTGSVVKPNIPVIQPSNLQPLSTTYSLPFELQDNPQNQFFTISRSFKAIKLKRVSNQQNDGNMYTFFKNGVIPKGEIIQFSFRQRTRGNVFNIGIGTKATFGDKAPDESIKYQSKQLWIDNKKCFIDDQMFNVPHLQQNSSVKININTRQWTIGWFIDRVHVVTKQIPVKMRIKNFYLTIALYNHQDELQLLQE